jgi:hypothetical protein
MFELPLWLIIATPVIVFIIAYSVGKARGAKNDVGSMNKPRPYGSYESIPISRRAAPSGYSSGNSSPGNAYQQDAEIEAMKTKIWNLERTVATIQDDLRNLGSGPGSGSQHPRIVLHKPQNAIIEKSGFTAGSTNAPAASQDALSTACGAYRKLSTEGLRNLPAEPLFVVLDMDSSARGSALGEVKRQFKRSDSKQSAFVVFTGSEREGWIFPNPRISFTEAMKYVFPDLSYENFEEAKNGVEPRKVRAISGDAWETAVA